MAIVMIVLLSIFAAFGGDFSGIEMIVKFVIYGAVFILGMWLLTQPGVLIFLGIVILLIYFACKASED